MIFEKEYHEMLGILTEAKSKLELIDNEQLQPMIKRITVDISRYINSLSTQLRLPIQGILETAGRNDLQPLKSFLGKPIQRVIPEPAPMMDEKMSFKNFEKINKESAEEVEIAELRAKRDELYPEFTLIDTAKLLDEQSDLIIRAIAKQAGLPVSDTVPKRIDAKFVEQIKEAIKLKENKVKDDESKGK